MMNALTPLIVVQNNSVLRLTVPVVEVAHDRGIRDALFIVKKNGSRTI